MSQPIPVDILSDDDECGYLNTSDPSATGKEAVCIDLSTPVESYSKKKPRISEPNDLNPSTTMVFIIDDDPTPLKHSFGSASTASMVAETPPISSHCSKLKEASITKCSRGSFVVSSIPSIVEETPISELSKAEVRIVKCANSSRPQSQLFFDSDPKSSENRLIHLGSDNESKNLSKSETWKHVETTAVALDMTKEPDFSIKFAESTFSFGETSERHFSACSSPHPNLLIDDTSQACGLVDEESNRLDLVDNITGSKGQTKGKENLKRRAVDAKENGRMSKEERLRLKEEKRQQREQEKLQKAAQKAEAAEMKKVQKEKQKWEKGKFALKSIVAEIDTKVVEVGSIGGHLLTRFAEKGLSFRIKSNPIERSIVWTMTVPEELSQMSSSEEFEIPYVLLVYEAEEFCNLVASATVMEQVSRVQHHHPHRTICFLTNRLMAYVNKREQSQYKDHSNCIGWKRPPIEEALAKLTTHFVGVHSRLCVDEAELAEHVTGLTCSLASCQFRKKLTRLSVNANGSLVPKDCADRNLIKKNLWLKALVAIPKVQPRFAIAIWKKYPTMKSLLSVYMDPSKSVHEKEFLLKDLTTEGLLGDDRRVGEICSKRVYRILMAQCGSIRTEDVENGADFFRLQT
ncbi:hypothetical protein M9H77_13142 [Catharanthus roseus]|uniref:Uncharacterized protein n=1 Tax=Catharanthus roseus TaxID=4058 RepID=A0ACC0BJI4_CATRO|nr:hypothetical protein M9H77_13142 [Catharanthus roseus]